MNDLLAHPYSRRSKPASSANKLVGAPLFGRSITVSTLALWLAVIFSAGASRSVWGQTPKNSLAPAPAVPAPAASASTRPDQATANASAVEAGKKALGSATDFPWYDAKADELKRINIRPEKPVKQSNYNGPDWDFSWLTTAFESIGVLLKVLIYIFLFGILAVLTYFVVRAFLGRDQKDGDDEAVGDEDEEASGGVDRVEELPIQLAAPRGDFLSEARRRYEAGDYSGAVIYLFSHQLLQLDRHQRIQLTRGKTNRQYLREVRGEPRLQEMLSRTMVAFEDVFFGHRKLERERFEECWREVDEFHRLTPQGGAA